MMSKAGTAPTPRSQASETAASTPEERTAALTFLTALAAEVSKGTIDLPCFPDVVVRISSALADPQTTAERVVTIVGAEPRLAARILQTANSAAFNSSGKPLTDLRTAITRIGQQMVQSTALSYAMQQVKNEESLRAIAEPLAALWNRSVAVASLCQLVAQRTKVGAEEAYLTGLLHGIGNLYIMVRATHDRAAEAHKQQAWFEFISSWQASIGKAVLESWGFAEPLCEAVAEQNNLDRRWKHEATLADVLVASIVLADALPMPEPRVIGTQGINAFLSIGVTPADCNAILIKAEQQIRLVHEALG